MTARRVTLMVVIAAMMCVSQQVGLAQVGGSPWPAWIEFMGLLAQKHPYLLEPADRVAMDEINRDFRMAMRQLRSSVPPDVKDKAAAHQAEIQKRLAAMFEKSPGDQDLLMTMQQLRSGAAPSDLKDKAAAVQVEAKKRLVALLEKTPGVVRVTFVGGKAVLAPAGPFRLPGDTGALLFRVEAGTGDQHFSTREVNFSEIGEAPSSIALPVEGSGTTWALVGFSHVPRNRTHATVSFEQGVKSVGRTPIDLMTPEQGRLKLTVLSDDSGQKAPAMVRLVWKTDGRSRQPSNGIDFGPQFDHLGSPERIANLPGKLRGNYWTVPGPIDMALPAGEWEATIRRGMEHVPVIDTFTVSPNQTVEKRYRPRRWVNMPARGWYSGDDHVHIQILSEADAQRMMTWAKAEDVHLCNIVRMGDVYRTWFEQRGFGKTYRVVDGNYVLAPGQEDPRTHEELGHTLAMNISSLIHDPDHYFLYDWVFDQVHAQGGLSGYAHVLFDIFQVHRDMSINIPKNKIDFVELLQFFNMETDLFYDFLNTGFKMTASAGTDVPWGGTIGEVRVYARTSPGPLDADRWFEAVRHGHTFVTDGPMLEFTVDQALPGDQIDVKSNKPLHVKARVWGDPEASMPSKLEIIRNGESIKSVQPTDPAQKELAIEFDVDPANGFWIAARAEGTDGTRAHTTPIYVVKPGLRFWKFDDVDALIAKRLASLDEVEALVKDRIDKNERGEAEFNLAYKQLALQGPELMKRVAAARQIYEDLRKVADQERPMRDAATTK